MTWTTLPDLNDGDVLTGDHMDQIRGNIEYLLNPNSGLVKHNKGSSYYTTSTGFVDVDSENLSIALTTNGGPVLVLFVGTAYISGATLLFDIAVDGTRFASDNAYGLARLTTPSGNTPVSFAVLVDGLSAGTHTLKLQWRVTSSIGDLSSHVANVPITFQAIEL